MQISHVAGFGPVVRDVDASRRFWGDDLGIALAEQAPDYFTNESLDGVRYFGLWPLSQAAQATFATDACRTTSRHRRAGSSWMSRVPRR